MASPKLSIILLSYSIKNSDKFQMLSECVYSVRKNTRDFELIIVDNGSTCEKSVELMQKEADTYIRLKENQGFGPGMNTGYKLAKGEYVCFLNDDIVLPSKWAEYLIESCGDGVCCPGLWPNDTMDDPVEGKIFRLDEWAKTHDHGVQNHGGFGACFIAKKETFDAVLENDLVFDEQFRIAMFEDTDLWMRMRKQGRKIVCDTRAYVYHIGNGTVGKIMEFHQAYQENEAKYKAKWKL